MRQATAFCAASSRSDADTMSRPEADRIFFASSTFVPVEQLKKGTLNKISPLVERVLYEN